jgi:hypothetical protein
MGRPGSKHTDLMVYFQSRKVNDGTPIPFVIPVKKEDHPDMTEEL